MNPTSRRESEPLRTRVVRQLLEPHFVVVVLAFAFSTVVGWARLNDRVSQSVPVSRFQAESIRVEYKFSQMEQVLEATRTNSQRLMEICTKVQAGCR